MTTTPTRRPSVPRGLGRAGRKIWRDIVGAGTWELRPDEQRILADACAEADLIDDLAEEAKSADKLVRGSQGQLVINPLISELRQHRATLASLLTKIKLPDDQVEAAPRSVGARKAAQSRWGKPA